MITQLIRTTGTLALGCAVLMSVVGCGHSTYGTRVVRAGNGQLSYMEPLGIAVKTRPVTNDAVILLDQREVALEELTVGHIADLTVESSSNGPVITSIIATSTEQRPSDDVISSEPGEPRISRDFGDPADLEHHR